MSARIALFYHCLFEHGEPIEFSHTAFDIVTDQMAELNKSGLLSRASFFIAGINGGTQSVAASSMTIPSSAKCVFHGPMCKSENLTLLEIEKWVPGHEDWYVLYFHAKGCTHPEKEEFATNWRECMMANLVWNWKQCISDLDSGYESVGCHWKEFDHFIPPQRMWAGNFWWARASFLATLPSICLRPQIKETGIESEKSRYESEIWIGNGPRAPMRRDYHPDWNLTKIPHWPV
jgi:hypothetical protein